jgi:hypothetical protein
MLRCWLWQGRGVWTLYERSQDEWLIQDLVMGTGTSLDYIQKNHLKMSQNIETFKHSHGFSAFPLKDNKVTTSISI